MRRALNSLLLQGNVVLFTASQMVLFSILPYLAEKSDLELSEVTLAFSVGSFLFLFSSPFWGWISDCWGHQKVITVGVFGLFISNLFIVLMLSGQSAHWILWGGRVLYGISASAIVPITQTRLIHRSNEGSLRPLLKNSIALNIGRALGPAYLVFSSLVFVSFSSSVMILTLICALTLILNLSTYMESENSKTPKLKWSGMTYLQWTALGVGFLFSVYVGGLNLSLAQIFMERLNMSAQNAATLMAKVLFGSAVLAVLIQVAIKHFIRSPWKGLLLFGVLSLNIGNLIIYRLSQQSEVPALVLFLSVGLCIIPPCYIGIVAENSKSLALKTSLLSMINTIGYSVGGIFLSSFLKYNLKIESLILSTGLFLLFSILFLHILKLKGLAYEVR